LNLLLLLAKTSK